MKKYLFSLLMSAMLLSSVGCSNWNRVTPAPLDNTTIEAEVRKNFAADGITGLGVEVHGGVVTLTGHLPTTADRQKALDGARKVPGVTSVVNRIEVP
jgi:osmotically-inducible protein OsmY